MPLKGPSRTFKRPLKGLARSFNAMLGCFFRAGTRACDWRFKGIVEWCLKGLTELSFLIQHRVHARNPRESKKEL